MGKKKTNGKPGNGHKNENGGHKSGHGHDDVDVMTVTFRIPTWLKKKVEAIADQRGATTTRVVVDALTNEVTDVPPDWWWNRMKARPRSRVAEGRA
jgi:predicted transcriptional regulator